MMKITVRFSLIAYFVGVPQSMSFPDVVAQAQVTVSPAQVIPEVRFIAAGIENSRQQLACAQGSISYYQFTPKEFLPASINGEPLDPIDREVVRTGRWILQDSILSMFVVIPSKDPNGASELYRIVARDTEALTYNEFTQQTVGGEPKSVRQGAIRSAESVLKRGMWNLCPYLDPRAYTSYFGHPMFPPLNTMLLRSGSKAVYKGEEQLYGTSCMRVDVQETKRTLKSYWFDAAHSFLLRRMESNVTYNGGVRLQQEWIMPEIIEGKGAWLPAVVEVRTYVKGKEADAQSGQLPQLTKFTISNFSAGCDASEKDLTIRWPLDTNVTDVINQVNLRVVAVERANLKSWNERRKQAGQSEVQPVVLNPEELKRLNQQRKQQEQLPLEDPVGAAVPIEDLPSLLAPVDAPKP